MSVQVGDMLPHGSFQVMTKEGVETIDVTTFFADSVVINKLFAWPIYF